MSTCPNFCFPHLSPNSTNCSSANGKTYESNIEEELSFYKNSDFLYFSKGYIFGVDFIDGKWTISGQYIIFKSDDNKIDAKYSVKVLSPTEIELIPIEGSELFRGRYNK